MSRENKTVGNRDNFFGNLLIAARGRRRLAVAADWLRAEYRHASPADIDAVVAAVEQLIKERRVDGIV